MKHYTDKSIYTEVSRYIKIYPDNAVYLTYNQPRKIRIKGFIPYENEEQLFDPYKNTQTVATLSTLPLSDFSTKTVAQDVASYLSLQRTKTKIRDIVYSTKFDLFATFTFATERGDIDACKKKMRLWLKAENRKQKFQYIIIAEFHKDLKSIHFHALLKGYTGHLHNSHKIIKGRLIYNISSYKHGFTTVAKIDQDDTSHKKVAAYVTKYITKEMPHFSNKNKFWVSKGITRPIKIQNPDMPLDYEKYISSTSETKDFLCQKMNISKDKLLALMELLQKQKQTLRA